MSEEKSPEEKQLAQLIDRPVSFLPYNVSWLPHAASLVAVGSSSRNTGTVAVYAIEAEELSLHVETETKERIRCAAVTDKLVTGTFEGVLQHWDLERMERPVSTTKAHDTIINMVAAKGTEVLTSSRDGVVKLWDTRQSDPIGNIFSKEPSLDAWSVAFGNIDTRQLIAIGYENGDLALFDISAAQYVWKTNVGAGVCSLTFSSDDTTLIASTLEGMTVVQLSTEITVSDKPSSKVTYWTAKYMPQNDHFVGVAAGDGTFQLLKDYNRVEDIKASNYPAMSCDWHRDKQGLFAICSFDRTIKIGMALGTS